MIETVISIAIAAGRRIMDVRRAGTLDATTKTDQSPLTLADIAANELICTELVQAFEYPIQSEERCVDYSERQHWQRFWLVDPLDGTREYAAGLDQFCVSIALIDGGRPVLGVLHAPASGDIYCAEVGQGAYFMAEGLMKPLPTRIPPRSILARSRFHDRTEVDEFAALNKIKEFARIGSALKFGQLASGDISVYPRFEECQEWDTAAGQIILEEAGGQVVDLSTGQAPVYNKRHHANNPFVAVAAGVDFQKLKGLNFL